MTARGEDGIESAHGRLEVRAVLLIGAAISIALALTPAGPALWLVAVATVASATILLGDSRHLLWEPRWLLRVALLALFAVGINALSTGEGTRLTWGGMTLPVSREGIRVGLETGVRLTAMVFLFRAVVHSIEPMSLVQTVERALAPLRRLGVRTESVSMATMIAMQVGPTFAQEAQRLSRQRALRTAWPGPTAPLAERRNKLRLGAADLPAVVVPLTQLALRRADELAWALPARHFGSAPRTLGRAVAWGAQEWAWLAAATGMFLFALWRRVAV